MFELSALKFTFGELIMEYSGSQIFTFTWRIENFSMCPHGLHGSIESPTFVVDFLKSTQWILEVYPRGSFTHDILVSLRRARGGDYTQSITIMSGFAALSTTDGKDIKEEMERRTYSPGDYTNILTFCSREKIFESESGLLPNDTLTLRCWLGACVDQEESVLQYPNVDVWNSSYLSQRYECSVRTRIKVSTTSFVWPIKRIDEIPCDVKLWASASSAVKNGVFFNLSFELKEDSEGAKEIQIEMHLKDECKEGLFTRCHIKTAGAPRNVHCEGKGEYYFGGKGKQKVWKFPTFCTINNLKESYFSYTDNTLYLQFDLSFSKKDEVLHIDNITEKFPLYIKGRGLPCASGSNFEKLYKDGEFVDATLRVCDQEFKVHKLVLIAGSDVFRRMFESNMKEQNTGIVEIDDLDPSTVERLLKYMYSHKLDELKPEDARKLYSAADKYNVDNLKCELRCALTTGLSPNTVCETLILSDAHHDEDLLTYVIDYIYKNTNEIFYSPKWKDFTANHSLLAASTMLQIWTKK